MSPNGGNSIRKVVVASTIGTVLEWYDFGVYGMAAALVFNKLFFPNSSPWVGTLLAFATFGVGFFARPFGGMLFGYVGDRIGRKTALMATIIIMGLGTTLIGLLPTYRTIGFWAPVLLIVLRLVQGFGAGAEYAGALVFIVESSKERRGFFGSFPSVSIPISIMLYSGIFGLLSMMPQGAFLDWGWRIPFLLSIVTAAVGLYLRAGLHETQQFLEKKEKTKVNPIRQVFSKHPKELIITALLQFQGVHTYIIQAFVLSYLVSTLKFAKAFSSYALLIAAFIGIFVLIISGVVADKKGLKAVSLVGAVLSGLFAFPMFALLNTGNPFIVILAMTIGLGAAYVMWGPSSVLLPLLFPVESRYSGVVIGREFANAIVGGSAPFIATLLLHISHGSPWSVAAYMVVSSAIVFVSIFVIKEDTIRKNS
ncbi:proline/betaine transporter [Peptococcaceae bacterium CEB3]|nr:proline/betaine transporter [Peptococcaceae bacterium CEB3]